MPKLKRVICVFLCCAVVAIACGCAAIDKIKGNSSSKNNNESAKDSVLKFAEDLNLSGSVYNIAAFGDLVKIEDVKAGLDSCSMTVYLYSSKENKQLAKVELPDKMWDTGMVNDGFYAADLANREYFVYDKSGKITANEKLPDTAEIWACAAISPNGEYLLYGDSGSATIKVRSLKDSTEREIMKFSGHIGVVQSYDDRFYLENGTGDVTAVDPEKDRESGSASSLYIDSRASLQTSLLGIGKNDMQFIAIQPIEETEMSGQVDYIPFFAADEIAVAAKKNAFATASSKEDGSGSVLRLYDINGKKAYSAELPNETLQAAFSDNSMVVLTKATNGKIEFFKVLNKSLKEKSFEISKNEGAIDQNNAADGDSSAAVNSYDQSSSDESYDSNTSNDVDFSQSNSGTSASVNNDSASSGVKTENKKVLSIPVIAQNPEYPTGCESVSTVMALKYAGYKISVAEFVDSYLEKSADFYYQDGIKIGPDPNSFFIGNPKSAAGFGCMSPVIENALKKYLNDSPQVQNAGGKSLDELCKTYIDENIPVIVWASIGMTEITNGASWQLENGESFTWKRNEHCLLLVGYDNASYYFNDPYTGSLVSYEKKLCQSRYSKMGTQAIVVVPSV